MPLVSCMKCDAKISENALKCPKCGSITSKHIPCKVCGTLIPIDYNGFCPECGDPKPIEQLYQHTSVTGVSQTSNNSMPPKPDRIKEPIARDIKKSIGKDVSELVRMIEYCVGIGILMILWIVCWSLSQIGIQKILEFLDRPAHQNVYQARITIISLGLFVILPYLIHFFGKKAKKSSLFDKPHDLTIRKNRVIILFKISIFLLICGIINTIASVGILLFWMG